MGKRKRLCIFGLSPAKSSACLIYLSALADGQVLFVLQDFSCYNFLL